MLPVTLVLTHCTCCFLKFKNNLKCSKIFFYNDGLFASKKKCAGCQPRYYLKRKKVIVVRPGLMKMNKSISILFSVMTYIEIFLFLFMAVFLNVT